MSRADTFGVILAGGLSRRMGGGDKPLSMLGGRPMLAHVIERLAPQCAGLAINANGDPARFEGFGLPVWPDSVGGRPGPLAGILAAMESSPLPWIVTVTGDAPFLPPDLVARLHAARARLAFASSAGRGHPPIGLWPRALAPALREAVLGGERRVGEWALAQGAASVEWDAGPRDPFFNANTPEELAEAARLLLS
ncbi:molybdenum cofactor guanylyltransferase MobA [Roseococcus sp. YIM B11640]|uniref:molybdenum cofactor guanylyltransferase MobA n=1 Tax=Roseococcus sp. YIM B11640 TaxID=3133973 RepID=UPI003C7B7D4C